MSLGTLMQFERQRELRSLSLRASVSLGTLTQFERSENDVPINIC